MPASRSGFLFRLTRNESSSAVCKLVGAIPGFQKQPTGPTLYYVFDVLWYNDEDLTGKPVLERRSVLERILKPPAGIQLGSYVEAEGKALFNLTKEKRMEGIIAKRKDSIYRPGKRTSDWLKIKARLQQEFVVGGFTTSKESGNT